jgi:hypothetical protein
VCWRSSEVLYPLEPTNTTNQQTNQPITLLPGNALAIRIDLFLTPLWVRRYRVSFLY